MNIKDLLEKNNLTQYTLSKKSGVPLSTVKKIVSGKQKIENCSGKTLRLLSSCLGISIEELLETSFDIVFPSLGEFSNKNDYYKKILINRKNVVLAKESASDYLHLSNSNLDENIYVYSSSDLPKPFVAKKVANFHDLDYSNIDGVLVTTVDQTVNDLLEDDSSDPQAIYESLASYYFDNNESFEGLNIYEVNEEKFVYYSEGAKHYYDED